MNQRVFEEMLRARQRYWQVIGGSVPTDGNAQDGENLSPTDIEANLSTEVALTVLDVLELFVHHHKVCFPLFFPSVVWCFKEQPCFFGGERSQRCLSRRQWCLNESVWGAQMEIRRALHFWSCSEITDLLTIEPRGWNRQKAATERHGFLQLVSGSLNMVLRLLSDLREYKNIYKGFLFYITWIQKYIFVWIVFVWHAASAATWWLTSFTLCKRAL